MASLRTAALLLASLTILGVPGCARSTASAPASPQTYGAYPPVTAPAYGYAGAPSPSPAPPSAAPPPAGDPRADAAAVQVINALMNALLVTDPDRAAQAVMPYVHTELMNGNRDGLSTDVRQFSFKKAHSNARFYKVPVEITRTRESPSTRAGYGPTAEPGRTTDYFIAKRADVDGMPAPIPVFFPANGGPPKITYLGNL